MVDVVPLMVTVTIMYPVKLMSTKVLDTNAINVSIHSAADLSLTPSNSLTNAMYFTKNA